MFICKVCSGTNFIEAINAKEMMLGLGKESTYFKCGDCGVLQIENFANSEELYPKNYINVRSRKSLPAITKLKKRLYKESVKYGMGNHTILGKLANSYSSCLRTSSIKDFAKPNNSIIDIGCGVGYFIEALAEIGFSDLTGIEPFIEEEINGNGFKVYKTFLSKMPLEKKYDIIMMHHSFEHVTDPLETLKNIKSLLAENGIIVIRIPVCDSYAYEKYKENWVQIDAPRHNFLHTNKSMNVLANLAGFDIFKIRDDSTYFQFIGSEQYKNNVSLLSKKSGVVSFIKKHILPSTQIKQYKKEAEQLNAVNRGDQRVFYLKHK